MLEKDGERSNLQPEVSHPDDFLGIHIPPLPKPDLPIISPDLELFWESSKYTYLAVQTALQNQADGTATSAGSDRMTVVEAPEKTNADFGVAVHRLSPKLGKPPHLIAAELADNFNQSPKPKYVTNAKADGPFLNFELDMNGLGTKIVSQIEELGDRYGEQNIGNGKTVIIDCSSPNIAKHMSVGHLRSTVIGESLAKIYSAGGYSVIRDNHLGDWGTQFGMLGRAVELWGGDIPELQDGSNQVDGLYQLYVKMHDEIEKEKTVLKSATGLEDAETSLEKEGRAWFQRLEEGDPQARHMWEWAKNLSLTEFQRVYDMLGVKFEYSLGESEYVGMLQDVVSAYQDSSISQIDDKGRVSVDLTEENLNPLVIQKSDGTSLYATRDLATLAARTAWFHPDKILYVVGGDQIDYFKQVFAAFKHFAGDDTPEMEHVYFGMVSLPEGKMSTRKGRVVFLEDVLQEAIGRAKEKIVQSNKEIPEDEIDKIASQVGVGSLIYFDLGHGKERNIRFDLNEALSFDGNTGPYLQYAHARANAILRKAEETGIDINHEQNVSLQTPIEIKLVKELGKFPEAIKKAIESNAPVEVATATFQIADLFSKFYMQSHILSDTDASRINSRLRLTAASAQVIKNGLNLLGIEAPERM